VVKCGRIKSGLLRENVLDYFYNFRTTFHRLKFDLFMRYCSLQWCQLDRDVPSTFTNGWARGTPWVEKQQTRNWPNCTNSPKWLIALGGGARPKKFFRRFAPDVYPHFQINSGATGSPWNLFSPVLRTNSEITSLNFMCLKLSVSFSRPSPKRVMKT